MAGISYYGLRHFRPLLVPLNDGEDFELLFTLSQENFKRLLRSWDEPTAVTQIGAITDTKEMKIKMVDGQIINLHTKGYDHLKNEVVK